MAQTEDVVAILGEQAVAMNHAEHSCIEGPAIELHVDEAGKTASCLRKVLCRLTQTEKQTLDPRTS